MEFPETFEKFAKEYGFKDDKEVYTNGLDLIPIFRVKQWLEHDNRDAIEMFMSGYIQGVENTAKEFRFEYSVIPVELCTCL